MPKISRVRQIERMEHAFRPVGLKGSRERPAQLTIILNYLEKVCCRPSCSEGEAAVCVVAVRSPLVKVSSLFLSCF